MTLTPLEREQRPMDPATRAPGALARRPTVPLRTRIPLLVLAASLLLTAGAGFFAARLETARNEAAFATAVQSTRDRIEHRLGLNVSVLQGVGGLFASSGAVTPEEFRAYVHHVAVDERFPGVQGVGFARRVTSGDVDALERTMRARGLRDFHVWPADARSEHFPIVYLEPLDARNRAALGFDMFTEPVRAAAMAAARDRGTPILSGRVRLVQEIDQDVQPGFLIYEPVYESGTLPATVEERRAALVGWVYSPYRARDLFTGIFGSETEPRVSFRIYDGETAAPEHLLFDSRRRPAQALDPSTLRDTIALPVFGRTWTLAFAARPSAADRTGRLIAPGIVLFGGLVSLALFLVTRAEVQARARAQYSERTRSRFYATMSHELRTPLNAIIGYNDLLLLGVYGPLAETQQRGIERSQKAASHLLDVVNDVLDLSKIEAGKMDLDDEPVAVASLVHDLFTTLHRMAEEVGTTLRFESDDPTHRVITDARRVRQILLNLLSNAIKFGSGNPVLVRAVRTWNGGVQVEVVDRGPGIAQEDQEQIFEEFVQLPSIALGGTGLGLPISRKLATILGGTLAVESAPGEGATFRLTLPAVRPGAIS